MCNTPKCPSTTQHPIVAFYKRAVVILQVVAWRGFGSSTPVYAAITFRQLHAAVATTVTLLSDLAIAFLKHATAVSTVWRMLEVIHEHMVSRRPQLSRSKTLSASSRGRPQSGTTTLRSTHGLLGAFIAIAGGSGSPKISAHAPRLRGRRVSKRITAAALYPAAGHRSGAPGRRGKYHIVTYPGAPRDIITTLSRNWARYIAGLREGFYAAGGCV